MAQLHSREILRLTAFGDACPNHPPSNKCEVRWLVEGGSAESGGTACMGYATLASDQTFDGYYDMAAGKSHVIESEINVCQQRTAKGLYLPSAYHSTLKDQNPRLVDRTTPCLAGRFHSIVEWKNGEDGKMNAYVSASNVSSRQLKSYLDSNYPGQYSVQLKRDLFRITVPRS
ncbi:hypothetical protein V2G26_012314 [Clonostachys chloroleuca]